jgi:outer membrane protein insertion porin family
LIANRALLAVVVVACGGGAAVTPARPPPVAPVKSAAAPHVDRDALVGPIRALEIKADAAVAGRARELLAGEVGQAIDHRRLRGTLAKVYALPGVSDVIATGVQLADGIRLVVEIVPQPTIHAVVTREHGGAELALPVQLVSAIGLPLDPALLQAAADQLRDRYLERGYVDAAADWQTTPATGGQVDVAIEVVPGAVVTIDRVTFVGNAHAKPAALTTAIGADLVTGAPWVRDRVDRGSLGITSYYYDHGFINVTVETPEPSGDRVALAFTIHEGDQYRLGAVAVTGVTPEQAKRYTALHKLKRGDVFDRSAVAAAIAKLTDAAHADAMPTAYVTPLTNVDAAKKTIDLTFELAK